MSFSVSSLSQHFFNSDLLKNVFHMMVPNEDALLNYYLECGLQITVQFSCSVMSDSFWPQGLLHARLPWPSSPPGVYSNSCPLNLWCHPTSSSSVVPLSSPFNLSQHQGLFKWVSSSHQVAKVLEFKLQHQSFQWTFRTDFLQDELVGSPCSPRGSQESSPTSQFKSINSSVLSFLYSPNLTSIHDYGKTIALTRWIFVSKVMSLLFNMLFRLVITFLPRSKRLLISWLQSPSAVILEPPKIMSLTVSTVSPSICHEVMGPDVTILVFWMLSFKPTFSLSSFTFIKRLFSSSSLYAITVVSSAYLRLLIFLPAILIPACSSSSPAFPMMYSAYKLNKQGDNIQPWCIPFSIWNQSVVPCPVLKLRFFTNSVGWQLKMKF